MARRIRTFIALQLTANIRQRLVAWQEKLAAAIPDVKWVEPENLHVTLLFLGEVPDREVAEVCQRVEEAVAEVAPFPVLVEGMGCFPESRRPRVLWAGITTGAEQLQRVHALLEQPLHYLGFRCQERLYVPHITLGRLKADREVPRLPELLREYGRCRGGQMLASEICILASQLERTGPVYTVMGRARFRGEDAATTQPEAAQKHQPLTPSAPSDEEARASPAPFVGEDFLQPGDEPLMD